MSSISPGPHIRCAGVRRGKGLLDVYWTFSFLRLTHAGLVVAGHFLEREGCPDLQAGEVLAACGVTGPIDFAGIGKGSGYRPAAPIPV